MTHAIVQARMTSRRLPGKVLASIGGRPLLAWLVERARRARTIDCLAVATSTHASDEPIVALCEELDVVCLRGDLHDVLDRYRQAAWALGSSVIVRLTADNPLVDPAVIDDVVRLRERERLDYAANTMPPPATYPHGFDVEVFTAPALERAASEAVEPSEREHVTFHLWKNPGRFSTGRLDLDRDRSGYRLTVDHPTDLEAVRAVVRELGPAAATASMAEILDLLDRRPDLRAINSGLPEHGRTKQAERAEPVEALQTV